MRGAENFCGSGTFSRDSLFREVVFAYISTGTQGGNFKCTLTTTKQNCNCGWSATARIANGQNAAANEYPSYAALKDVTSKTASFCGGTIGEFRSTENIYLVRLIILILISLNILYFEQTVTVFDFAVSHRYIVTAAHCIYMVNRATDVVAIVGTNNLVNRKLTEIIVFT